MGIFSDKSIRALLATGVTRRVFEGASDPGFGVQITAAGTKSFFLQYLHEGKRRFLSLGVWPATSLADARTKARAARALVDAGDDPRREAPKSPVFGTVRQMAEGYRAHLVRLDRRSAGEVWRGIEKNAFPVIGDLAARDVTPLQIREILFNMIQRGAPVGANRVRVYLHGLFRYGILHDNDPRSVGGVVFGIEHNPVDSVPRDTSAESVDNRALTWDEIGRVWNAEELGLSFRLAVQLLIATGGQRSGEVTRAAWSEFDIDSRVWILPAARAKNKREHLIPLTDLAIGILSQLRGLYYGSEWLFPSRHNSAALKPWNESTLAHAVQDYCRVSGMDSWVPKDLRRTCMTRMGELGIAEVYRDMVQNRIPNTIGRRHYDRYDYHHEKLVALKAFEDKLKEII